MLHRHPRWIPLLAFAAMLAAADAAPTLAGSAFEVTIATAEYKEADGQKVPARSMINVWDFQNGLIIVTSKTEQGRRQVMPYTVAWKGRTAQVVATDEFSAVQMDATIDRDSVKGKATLLPVALARFGGKPPLITVTGKRCEPTLGAAGQLAKAKDLQLQRKPKEALALFTRLIDEHTSDLEFSLPALNGLVECSQLLKGDAAVAKAYGAVAKEYCLTLPALDGSAMLDREKAGEELLWGRLGDGHDVVWEVSDARWSTYQVGDKPKRQLSLQLKARTVAGPFIENREKTAATATSNDGTSYASTSASVSPTFGQLFVFMTFETVPDSLEKLATLTVPVPLTLPKLWTRNEIRLQKDQAWEGAQEKSRIVRVDDAKDGIEVELQVVSQGTESSGGGSSSSASSGGVGMGGGLADSDSHAPFLLKDQDGNLVAPDRSAMHGRGNTAVIVLHFCKPFPAFTATTLVAATVAERSVRTIQVSVKDVQLP